ncbi:hypothetical protein OCU04_003108 [Sclerotinia nivalis]|uniref:RING-type domain-containing protein n=1 Tax=Sclerotinia nivalis TaxID=352851 RepID=A0A9X0DN74_9HELO|nr:hypothetical protein OCU04_003108 [Sclerotinia nivalis]
MTSGYPYSPHYNNGNSNTAPIANSNSNSNHHSPWNNESFVGRGESLTLPPISRTNSGNRLELPGLSSSPLFIPESHTRQVQPELSSQTYGSMANANANAIANTNAIASTSASTIVSNPERGRSHIKRPRSASPPDLFSFDPFDESNRYRSPPPLLPSPNQVARQNSRTSPQRARGSSFYDEDAEALSNVDWDSFLSQDNGDIDDPFASPPRMPSRASNPYGVVDLTDSSPAMAPPSERRRALSGTSLRPATLTRAKSPKRRKPTAGSRSTSAKRRKLLPQEIKPEEDVEVVDLAENANLQEYEAAKAKRQEDLTKQQNQDEATKPVKLVDFQCIICMDNPTDLTVTHCGHLFCSECLHSALHAGNNGRKTCPVCRTLVSTTSLPGRKPPKNGTFPIAIKLMTANKMGKKPKQS